MESVRNTNPRWYALVVKTNYEKVVSSGLRGNGVDEFLPLYKVRRAWCDRVKQIQLPLFSGYVFARFPYVDRVPVLRIPGVISVVGFGGGPIPVDDNEIDTIKKLLSSNLPLAPWPFPKVGQRVQIEGGCLRGLEGILLKMKDHWRVIVSIQLLRRSVAVEIDRELVSVTGGQSALPRQGTIT